MLNTTSNLGTANDFNIFLLGDHTQSNVDSEGRVAVGGNASYSSYGVGSKLEISDTRADLIVGGDMDIIDGRNFSGNSAISENGSIINYTMSNANDVTPQPQVEDIIDFNAEGIYLKCLSDKLLQEKSNGAVELQDWNGLYLIGTDVNLNVFSFDATDINGTGTTLEQLVSIDIQVPDGCTVVINALGDTVGFGQYSIFWNGSAPSSEQNSLIFWNIPKAKTLTAYGISIRGSILAPYCDAVLNNGNFEGTLVCNSLTGSIEAHNYPFNGTLPSVECGELYGTVGGFVWVDYNEDGIADDDEPKVSGVLVTLYDYLTDIATEYKTVTDEDGYYLIEDVADGEYYAVFSDISSEYMFSPIGGWVDETGKQLSDIVIENGAEVLGVNAPIIYKNCICPPGEKGEKGEQGEQGIQGEKGCKGDKGEQGIQGEKGCKGDKGEQGIQGEKGCKGDKGEQGKQGEKGCKGDKGEQGKQGEKGCKGDHGEQGKQGEKGCNGDKGEQGKQGGKGCKGEQGEQGIQGEKGCKGDKGEQGKQGGKGCKGEQGEQGIQGGKGCKGDKGEQGKQGEKGCKGEKGEQGCKGDRGVMGCKGDKGEQGCKGDKGDRGEKGCKGDKGADGTQYTISNAEIITVEEQDICPNQNFLLKKNLVINGYDIQHKADDCIIRLNANSTYLVAYNTTAVPDRCSSCGKIKINLQLNEQIYLGGMSQLDFENSSEIQLSSTTIINTHDKGWTKLALVNDACTKMRFNNTSIVIVKIG